ncbi:MAG: hypothetical protein ABSA77_08095 [Thermoguttaceae bacterium]|jgi:hypothetical protein
MRRIIAGVSILAIPKSCCDAALELIVDVKNQKMEEDLAKFTAVIIVNNQSGRDVAVSQRMFYLELYNRRGIHCRLEDNRDPNIMDCMLLRDGTTSHPYEIECTSPDINHPKMIYRLIVRFSGVEGQDLFTF